MATQYAPGPAFRPPPLPSGIYTDPQFLQDDESLRQEIGQRYAALARQLGYTDESGVGIPGEVELGAQRGRSDIAHARQQAVQDVTNRMQQAGTLFSGYRGDEQAKAEYPHVQALGNLEMSTGSTLSELYNSVMGLADEFRNRRAQALLNAISRRQPVDGSVDPGGLNEAAGGIGSLPADTGVGGGGAAEGEAVPPPLAAGGLLTGAATPTITPMGAAAGGMANAALPPPNPQIQPPAAVGAMTAAAQPRVNPRRQPAAMGPMEDTGGALAHTITIQHPSGHKITHKTAPVPTALGAAAKKTASKQATQKPAVQGAIRAVARSVRGGFG